MSETSAFVRTAQTLSTRLQRFMVESAIDNTTQEKTGRIGLLVSIAFWLSILLAGAIFALVALSSKIVRYFELKKEHYETQVRLVTLERQVKYLRKVARAFENDHDFTAEQARLEFSATRPGEERLPTKEPVELEANKIAPKLPRVNLPLPWYVPFLMVLRDDHDLRLSLLATAACITLLAFTFLHESQFTEFQRLVANLVSGFKRATSRYCHWDAQSLS